MRSNRLVLAWDLGTTFSGCAFCETSDTGTLGKEFQPIRDWPTLKALTGTNEKISTELAVDDHAQYGGLIPPNARRHKWTKLLLENNASGELEKITKELSLNPHEPANSPVTILGAFLACAKEHLIKNLDTQYGKALWSTLPITLVITVPAVWSDSAQDATLRTFEKGGFSSKHMPQLKRTILDSEPEAAAIYTIQSMRGSVQDDQVSVGDGFIVCDMGGGTIDLIAYRITGLEPTKLEEATTGTGDQCGGSFVERGFLRWLERRLGTVDFIKVAGERSEGLPRTSLAPKVGRMVQDFTLDSKSGISGTETTYLRLPAPLSSLEDDETRGIVDGEIMITADDMKEMFEFPLRRCYELILQRLKQARRNGKVHIKYLFMVGGFAESPYMYEKLKTFGEDQDLDVSRPAFAWSAIVRGAAMRGLEGDGRPLIENRKCRRNYGTSCTHPFKVGKDKEIGSIISPYTGAKMATNQMKWLLFKGQDLSSTELPHAKKSPGGNFCIGDNRTASFDLLASDVDQAAKRSVDKSVYKIATLDIDLSGVPASAFHWFRSPAGVTYYRVEYQVEISIESSLEFSVLVDGVRYGFVTAQYS